MIADVVQVGHFQLPPCNRREILRYAACREPNAQTERLLDGCIAETAGKLHGRVCWRSFPVQEGPAGLELGFLRTSSQALRENLRGCSEVCVFAATLGLELDRLLARYSRLSPARALLLQALGAERIEALCDVFCAQLRGEAEKVGLFLQPRFSPGYGDFPLETQRAIFRVLDCQRKIGLTLNESLLMSPSKSVTALVGVGKACTPCPAKPGCAGCEKSDCMYRRIGS